MRQEGIAEPYGVRWPPESPTGVSVLVLAGSSGRMDAERARGGEPVPFIPLAEAWEAILPLLAVVR